MPSTPEENEASYFRDGVLPILAASFLWAFVYFFRKTAIYGMSPLLFTLANSLIGCLSLALFFRLQPREIWRFFLRAPYRFAALGFSGVTVGTTLMIVGLEHLDLSIALVLEKLQPIFTWILAAIFLGEKIRRHQIVWVLLAVTSSYFVSVRDPLSLQISHSNAIGVAAILGAALSWGFSSVIGRSLVTMRGDYRQLVFLRQFLGALFLLPFAFFAGTLELRLELDLYVISVVVISAVFGSTAGYVLFYRGLRYVSATVSGFLELVTPVVGAALGIVFLRESPSLSQSFAVPLLFLSVFQLSRVSPSNEEG